MQGAEQSSCPKELAGPGQRVGAVQRWGRAGRAAVVAGGARGLWHLLGEGDKKAAPPGSVWAASG